MSGSFWLVGIFAAAISAANPGWYGGRHAMAKVVRLLNEAKTLLLMMIMMVMTMTYDDVWWWSWWRWWRWKAIRLEASSNISLLETVEDEYCCPEIWRVQIIYDDNIGYCRVWHAYITWLNPSHPVTHARMHFHLHTHIRTQAHTHTPTHTHTHTHARMCIPPRRVAKQLEMHIRKQTNSSMT